MKKVLVTGADGLLGANLVRELLGAGYEVRVFSQAESLSPALHSLPVTFIRGDIRDAARVLGAARGVALVFHCAAVTDFQAPRALHFAVNRDGTRNVVRACLTTGVERLFYIGSASTFQFGSLLQPGTEEGVFPEAYRGISYMESKTSATDLVRHAVKEQGLDAVILAPTFMLGEHDARPSSGELLRRYVSRGLRVVSPGGRNFVHVKDVARAAVAAITLGQTGRSYLLAGENLHYQSFFTKVAVVAGSRPPVAVLPSLLIRALGAAGSRAERRTGQPSLMNRDLAQMACLDTFYSPARARQELHLSSTSIDVAIEDAIKSLRAFGHLPPGSPGGVERGRAAQRDSRRTQQTQSTSASC